MAGTGTGGSRAAGVGGAAIGLAAERVIDKCRTVAAHKLEAAEEDIAFDDGTFTVVGTDRTMTLIDAAKMAQNFMTAPPGMEIGLSEWAAWRPPAPTFPNGCHVCEVEIDQETGTIDILAYKVIDDVGTVLNPLLLKGQIQGGVAHGIGQALTEEIRCAPVNGQLIPGPFRDYSRPRADDMSNIDVVSSPGPTKTNPMGCKGAGEAGTVGAVPAVMNAVVDALSPLGVRHVDMPATPERIWRAIQDAKAATA